MTISKAIGAVVTCASVFGAMGGLLGGAIGKFVPSYYRSVFRGGNAPGFDPIAIGIGQGATQGIAGGILVGVILVGIIVWRDRRSSATEPTAEHQTIVMGRPTKRGWIFVAAGVGLLMSLGGCSVGVIIGALIGEQGAYDRQYQEEKRLIEESLASDSPAHRIEIEPRSNGGALVYGSVETSADHDRLRDSLTRALGESRAAEVLAGVDVRAAPAAADEGPDFGVEGE